jgi:hypothetical protein
LTLAIFVEGQSDKLSIPILLHKVRKTTIYTRRVAAGDMLDIREMARHIQALSPYKIEMAIIFRDSECTDPEGWIAKAKLAEKDFERLALKPPVRYVIVDHSLEGWLACDKTALRAVLGPHAKIPNRLNPACSCRPAEAMRKLFQHNNVRAAFNKVIHNPLMSENADPRVIEKESPTFAYLVNLLRVA